MDEAGCGGSNDIKAHAICWSVPVDVAQINSQTAVLATYKHSAFLWLLSAEALRPRPRKVFSVWFLSPRLASPHPESSQNDCKGEAALASFL